MKSEASNLNEFQATTQLAKTTSKINLGEVFSERKNSYLNEFALFIAHIDTMSLKIIKPKLNIEDNYNDDFKPIHQVIIKRLSKKNHKGLVLLHGNPGTGKTSYICYLISTLKKNVIFLPPNMAGAITNPE